MKKHIIIVGGGCAGLTCAIYLARFGHDVKVYCNYSYGCLTETSLIENFPGFPDGIEGFDLMDNMTKQAEKFGVKICDDKVEKVWNHKVYTDSGIEEEYDYVVFATGLTPNKLNLPNIDDYNNLHYCAVCDGSLYKDQTVAIVGGGDTALGDALYLANICKQVYMIVRRDVFRGSQILVDKVKNTPNIKIYFNNQIKEIKTSEQDELTITQLELTNGEILDINGLFSCIGFKVNNELFANKKIKDSYICGDCNGNEFRQAVIACGDGAKTAMLISKNIL